MSLAEERLSIAMPFTQMVCVLLVSFMCGRKNCRKRLEKRWEQEDVAERVAALPVVEEEGEKEMDE